MSGRSLQEQAWLEARAYYKKKNVNEQYHIAGEVTPSIVMPMLSKNVKESPIRNWPVIVQPKLDGVRMLTHINSDTRTVVTYSRGNKQFGDPARHIRDELGEFFPYLPQDCTLDGEVYRHANGDAAAIAGVLHKWPVVEDIDEYRYWIFDCVVDYDFASKKSLVPYELRMATLWRAFWNYMNEKSSPGGDYIFPKSWGIVPSYIARSAGDLDQLYGSAVVAGYEGVMIKYMLENLDPKLRHLTYYASKRNANTLKMKREDDAEFEIVDVKEGEGKAEGQAVFVCKTPDGIMFNVSPLGSFEQRRELFQKREELIGKQLTVRFFELSVNGIPKNPVGVAVRDYE
jgi:DNA ligase-1